MMKTIQLIATAIGLLIITGGVNSSFAIQVQVQTKTTFSCTSNADCKRKCEALGSDHTWKPNPGGSTFGTCTKRSQSLSEQIRVLKKRLIEEKKVRLWPTVGVKQPDGIIVELTPTECDSLGGEVNVNVGCGWPWLSCTTKIVGKYNVHETHEVCIDEFAPEP